MIGFQRFTEEMRKFVSIVELEGKGYNLIVVRLF